MTALAFLKKLLPIEFTSIPDAMQKTIREFGIVNLFKIGFFVAARAVKYKIALAKYPADAFVEKDVVSHKMLLNRKVGGIHWDLLVNGIREENSTYFLRDELKPGMNILEIGANIGYYLIQESQAIGSAGHIYAFEPDPTNVDLLKKNIALNDVTNVTFRSMALGNDTGTVDFGIAERGNLSGFTIKTDTTVPVEMDKGDNLLAGTRIDYLRMDVEGFEFDIVKGIEGLLRDSVQGMFVEIHPYYLTDLGTSMEEFLTWLDERDFELVKAYSDYDWNPVEFDSSESLLAYKYAEKMVWRSFFRKRITQNA